MAAISSPGHTAAAHFQMRPATMGDAGSLLLGIEPEISFF